ncbi:MAG TPA: hypothetical protein PKE03_11280, partial [Bacteroidales bacterium]|nr:hypothetical protein [Bacteroidales bacterium]
MYFHLAAWNKVGALIPGNRLISEARVTNLPADNEHKEHSEEFALLHEQYHSSRNAMYFILVISLLIISGLSFAVLYFRSKKILYQQGLKLAEVEKEKFKAQTEVLELENKLKAKEIERICCETDLLRQEIAIQSVKQTNTLLMNQTIREKLSPYQYLFTRKRDQDAFAADLHALCSEAERDPMSDFETMFSQMHHGFFEKLIQIDSSFTRSELQVCALLRMNLPS